MYILKCLNYGNSIVVLKFNMKAFCLIPEVPCLLCMYKRKLPIHLYYSNTKKLNSVSYLSKKTKYLSEFQFSIQENQ